jgi:POTRA domain, FtsQ-type
MLVAAGAIYGSAGTPAFGFERLEVAGNAVTTVATVDQQLGVARGANLVSLATAPIVERIRQIPAVADATVTVRLPDVIRVELTERRPILLWQVGMRRFTADAAGRLFAEVGPATPAAVASLPVIADQRVRSAGLGPQSTLDPTDLDAAKRLGSLTPDQIGSHASRLLVSITDEKGFTIGTGPNGWVAVFGFYGISQRTPALIPGQVQLLTALLAGREDTVLTVILADDRDGTYIPKPTPKPSPSAKP